jgi:hypothetical protein
VVVIPWVNKEAIKARLSVMRQEREELVELLGVTLAELQGFVGLLLDDFSRIINE